MSDDSLNPHTAEALDDLAGEYVLGTLDDEARRSLERRLPHEPALQEAITRWESRLTPYASMVEPLPPPPELWARIEHTVSEHPMSAEAAPCPSRGSGLWQGLWQSLALWRGVSMASLAVVLGLALWLFSGVADTRYLVVLATPQHTQAGWVIQAASQRDIELIPLEEFRVPAGKTLEFWTKADDWSGPVSLGLVDANGPRRLRLKNLPPLEKNQLFELTLEESGGSPLNRPTGPIQFIGRAVSL
ncbi:anti-sigma factor [Kushneria phyllosphaerae]|uniref:Regulator of SigK n=1 Tax=Kushneria phyllosphaerae TaxID=2100822 RepID=A0A2R8CHN0_9GAMM|nr:anti-sigma factor [Kushneria phyllosphaerae]SPJ32415.1 hypothetical protein KSP9073_00415 [Kushneria phyllosphaerae]